MTSGAPIFLVSACRSGGEFVAAFRRYADKNGLFVPIADPIPAGRRGRFAVTLADGGVMIEGEADVVSSGRTPSVLHGRVGMTLRFVEPDIKSKTVLIELEQARLAPQPEPPSVPPRPASVPATPRPVPPPPGGRIDAHTALAECVAIGDLAALEAATPAPTAAKFTVPSIPPVGSPRPKQPTTPPGAYPSLAQPKTPSGPVQAAPRAQTPSVPPPLTPPPPALLQAHPHTPSAPIVQPPEVRDTVAMPPLAVTPPGPFSATMTATPVAPRDSDTMEAAIPEPVPASPSQANGRPGLPPPRRTSNTSPPRMPTPAHPMPVVPRNPTPVAAMPTVKPRTPTPAAASPVVPTSRHPSGSTPVAASRSMTSIGMPIVNPKAPAAPAPAPTPPIVAEATPMAPDVDNAEPTAVTEIPIPQEAIEPIELHAAALQAAKPARDTREPRRTVIGVAVVPDGVTVLPAAPVGPVATDDDAPRDTALMTTPELPHDNAAPLAVDNRAQPIPPSGLATVEIQEPTGDWTMTPGAAAPTILPRTSRPSDPPPLEARAGEIPAKLPTGDWTIARVEDAPDGWSEPSKVKPPRARVGHHTGPPVPVVSGEKSLEVTMTPKEFEIEEATKSGNKVEIAADLAAVSQLAMPAASSAALPAAHAALPPAHATGMPTEHVAPLPPPRIASASGTNPTLPTDYPRLVTDAGTGFFRDSGEIPRYGTGEATAIAERKRRTHVIVIAASAALAITVGIVVLFALGGKKDAPAGTAARGPAPVIAPRDAAASTPSVGSGSGSGSAETMAVEPPADDAAVAIEEPVPDAAVVAPPPVAPTDCTVDVTSSPSGAEIVHGKDVLGTTPATLTLPCGTQTRLVLRKSRFAPTPRTVTPTAKGAKVRVALAKPQFSVKVSSSPTGATITSNGKTLGVTPTVIKLPANEPATIVIAKPGFTADTRKITPKQNNTTVHASLKKKGRR